MSFEKENSEHYGGLCQAFINDMQSLIDNSIGAAKNKRDGIKVFVKFKESAGRVNVSFRLVYPRKSRESGTLVVSDLINAAKILEDEVFDFLSGSFIKFNQHEMSYRSDIDYLSARLDFHIEPRYEVNGLAISLLREDDEDYITLFTLDMERYFNDLPSAVRKALRSNHAQYMDLFHHHKDVHDVGFIILRSEVFRLAHNGDYAEANQKYLQALDYLDDKGRLAA